MPWTPRAVRFLFSKGSPLTPAEKAKMERELHANPALGHARKGAIGNKAVRLRDLAKGR